MSNNLELEKSKEALLHFASSEITSHAANLLGLAVLLFAYLNIIYPDFPKICLNPYSLITLKGVFDHVVIFVIFWVLNSGILFAVMRLIYCGGYANAIICLPEDDNKVEMEKESKWLTKINEKRREFEKKEGKKEKDFKVWEMNDLNIKYLRDMISNKLTEKKMFGIMPYEWVSSGISVARSKGLAVAFFIGFWVSTILFIVFLVK